MRLAKVSLTGIAARALFNQGAQMSPVPLTRRVVQSVNPDESPHDADGFVGVDPVYQNFANDTDAPLDEDDEDEDDDDDDEDDDMVVVPVEAKATPAVALKPVVVEAPKPAPKPAAKEKLVEK